MSIVNIHPQKRLIICPFLIRITINNSTYAAAVGASVLLLLLILLHHQISGRLATHRSIYVIIRTSVERKEPLIDLPSIAFYKHTSPSSRSVNQSVSQVQIPNKGSLSIGSIRIGKGTSSHNSTKDGTRQPTIHPEMYFVQRLRRPSRSTNQYEKRQQQQKSKSTLARSLNV